MTQPSRSNQLTVPATDPPSVASDNLVDAYAENLMDELFSGVDQILQGDFTGQPQVSTAPYSPFVAETVTIPAMIVPASLPASVEQNTSTEALDANHSAASQKSKRIQFWLQVMFAAACLSGLTALGFWFSKTQEQSAALVPADTATISDAPTGEVPATSADAAFGEYLQRSLGVIDGQRLAQEQSTVPTSPYLPPTLGQNTTVPLPSGNRTPNVIERVFVPVFQPSQTALNRPILPLPSQSPALDRPNVRPAPANSPSATRAPSAGPSATSPTTTGAIPNISPMNTHRLLGVLELGERSAALFEINGIPQRVYVGESIGSSGWNVVSVANQEVVVRRNGEVRSIYIGQQF